MIQISGSEFDVEGVGCYVHDFVGLLEACDNQPIVGAREVAPLQVLCLQP